MRKRQIAIIPLIFASMIMLLSSIMPHHHHGKLICFTATHEHSSFIEKACNHEHDSTPTEGECEVRLLFQTSIVKQHHDECNCCPNIIPDQPFQSILTLAGLDHSLSLLGVPK